MWFLLHTKQLLIRVLPNKINQGTVLKCLDKASKTIKLPSVFTSIWENTHIPLSIERTYTVIYIQANTFQAYACCKFLIISSGLKEW